MPASVHAAVAAARLEEAWAGKELMPPTEDLTSSSSMSHAPVQPAAVRAAVEAASARSVFWPGNSHEALWDAPNGMTSDELVGRLQQVTGHLAMSPGRCSLRNSADLRSTARDAYSLTSLEQREELDAMMGGARFTWEPKDAAERPPTAEPLGEAPPPAQSAAADGMDISSAADAIVAAQAAVSRALIRPKSPELPSTSSSSPSDAPSSHHAAAPLPQSYVFTSGPSAAAAPLPPPPHRFGARPVGEEPPVLEEASSGEELPAYTSFMKSQPV